jgi:hypothetical protein
LVDSFLATEQATANNNFISALRNNTDVKLSFNTYKKLPLLDIMWKAQFFRLAICITADTQSIMPSMIPRKNVMPLAKYEYPDFISQQVPLQQP